MREDELHLEDCVPGAVVFARVKAFPWWPAIIGRTSEGSSNEWKDTKERRWVFFFGDDQGAWMPISNMKVYSDFNQDALLKANDRNEKYDKFREKIRGAVVLANQFLSYRVPPTENLEHYNTRITAGAIEPLPLPPHLEGKDDLSDDGHITETSDEDLTDTDADMDIDDGRDESLSEDNESLLGSVYGRNHPHDLPAILPLGNGNNKATTTPNDTAPEAETQTKVIAQEEVGSFAVGGDPGKTVAPASFYADGVTKDLGLHQNPDSANEAASRIEKASLHTSSSPTATPEDRTTPSAAAMDAKDDIGVEMDEAPSTSVQAPVPPVEYGRSKRKRIKSTKLNGYVDPIKKYRKRKSKTTGRRIAAKNVPENPEDIVTPAYSSSSSPPPSLEMVAKRRSNTEKNTVIVEPVYLIPLRLALKKTALKELSLENAPPRKRITRNMATPNTPGSVRVEASATPVRKEQVVVTDLDSGKKVSKTKSTEPWKTGPHDDDDEDEEGDTVNKKEVPNMSPRLKVTDNGSSKSLMVLVPKKALEEAAAAAAAATSGEVKRRPGRPPKGARRGLVSSGAGVSKRGAHLKGRSVPTRQTPPRRVRLLSEQATASASTSASVAAETKKISTRRGNSKNNASTPTEAPRVKRKYRKRGTVTNKDGTLVNGRGRKRSSERLKGKEGTEVEPTVQAMNADGTPGENAISNNDLAAGVLPNTVNILNGVVVPEGERQRKRKRPRTHYGSHRSTVRHLPPLPAIPVDGDAATESESEEVVAQRINAMKNAAPAAQQERIDRMMARIVNLEAHVHRLNKKQITPSPRDEMRELMRISAPTKSIARLKVATDMVFMAMREVVDETDYNPVKMSEVIQNIWPHDDEVQKNEPDRLEKEGIRSAVRGLLWDRQARGVHAHNKRKERIENQARRNNARKDNGSGNGNGNMTDGQMAVDGVVPSTVGGSDPNSSGGQSAAHSTQGGANN